MAKYSQFLTDLQGVLTAVGRNDLKASIGDSTNNNRTATVSQVIRFLTRTGATRKQRILGKNLNIAYGIIRTNVVANRFLNFRSDAIDINEFISTYEIDVVSAGGPAVAGGTGLRKVLGSNLLAA